MLGIINILLLICIALIVYYILQLELKDIFCSNGFKGGIKGDGCGKHLYNGKPESTDTLDQSLNKVLYLADYNKKSVKWRRCLVASFIGAFVIIAILNERIPKVTELLMTMLIIFVTMYAFYNYFQYHYDDIQGEYIKQNVKNAMNDIGTQPSLMK